MSAVPDQETAPTRRLFSSKRFLIFMPLLIAAGFLVYYSHRPHVPATIGQSGGALEVEVPPDPVRAVAVSHVQPPVSTPSAALRTPIELVDELAALSDPLLGSVTPEAADRFRKTLDELIARGAASVPAIQALLGKNIQSDYFEFPGGDQLGYSSLRASLIDCLRQIGGPEAQYALLQTLRSTAVPSELLEISKTLQTQAPGVYQEEILNAAAEAISMGNSNLLGANVEVGPAFRVLQNHREANAIEDVARNEPETVQQVMALANLPDAKGLPQLLQMVESPSGGSQIVAIQMIAQLAGQNSQALESLDQLAQNGQLSNGDWMRIAPVLAGGVFEPGAGNADEGGGPQLINKISSPDEITRRISLIDKFMAYVPLDSAAAAAMKQERGFLTGRLK
jgi:hypothetical protein